MTEGVAGMVSTGDCVSWEASGTTKRGIVRKVAGKGKAGDPAVRVEVIDGEDRPTGEFVNKQLSRVRIAKVNAVAPLYVYRPVLNAAEIIAWARSAGIGNLVDGADLHLTVAFSREPVPWSAVKPERFGFILEEGARAVERLGDGNALALMLDHPALMRRWGYYREFGASWDFDQYRPHITLSYDAAPDDMPAPFPGEIHLGPEIMEPLDAPGGAGSAIDKAATGGEAADAEGQGDEAVDFRMTAEIVTKSDEQRMVYGWFSVAEKGGEVITDLQGDQITEATLEHAIVEFAKSARVAKTMHDGPQTGDVRCIFPLTRDIQKALGVTAEKSGGIIGVHVEDDDTWADVKSGKLAGFSIGGRASRVDI